MSRLICPTCEADLVRKYPRKNIWECPGGHGIFKRTITRNRRTAVELNRRHYCARCRKKRFEKFMQLERHYHVLMWACVHCSGQFKVLKKGVGTP